MNRYEEFKEDLKTRGELHYRIDVRSEILRKLLAVVEEAEYAIKLEDERIKEGLLKLGQWTPLNVLREKVRALKEGEG